jgi:DNA-directed RNA polymerase subunit RPC12/RpoP
MKALNKLLRELVMADIDPAQELSFECSNCKKKLKAKVKNINVGAKFTCPYCKKSIDLFNEDPVFDAQKRIDDFNKIMNKHSK